MKFFRKPPGADKNKIPVHIDHFIEKNVAGLASPPDGKDDTPRLFFSDLLSKEDLHATSAHEFFHAIQFAYGHPGWSDSWIVESTAMLAEAKLFPASYFYLPYNYLMDINKYPLDYSVRTDPFQYGSSIFFHYLFSRADEISEDYKSNKHNIQV